MVSVLHVLCDLSGGGAERLVLDLCRQGLVHQEVATVHADPDVLAEAFRRAGVRVHRGWRRRGTAGLAAVLELARLAHGFDVVHTHLFAGDTWGRPAARLARKRVVTTEHNVNLEHSASRRSLHRAMTPMSDRLVYVSEAARTFAATHDRVCHPSAQVIPNGIELGRFTSPSRSERIGTAVPSDAVRLLAVGRDAPQKGFDVLRRALPPGAVLRVAGPGRSEGVERLPVPGGVATIEWLGEREDVPALLAETDVLVVPSRWEGFGLAALEGMAAGVPVVASAVHGLPELLGPVGVLVPKEDPASLRAALQRLLGDAPERARRGALGRERAKLFSIEACALRYAALYAEVAAPR